MKKLAAVVGSFGVMISFAYGLTHAVASCEDRPLASTDFTQADATPPRPARWEYKTLPVEAGSHEKQGPNALATNEIQVKDSDLNALGADGWELVTAWLEPETSFPNFGKGDFVTGIQPNVRPMRALLLFKRPVR